MGKYNRKSNRGSYSKEKLREAVREVEAGRMSGYAASKTYQVPRMTLMDHVKKRRGKSNTLGRNTALSPEIEFKLAAGLHLMEKHGFGLSRKEVLQMVGDYVNKNNLITPFKFGIPGKDWFLAFTQRHGLSLKKPQAVEYARKRAVDPFIVYPYFDLLEKTITALNLEGKPSSIWNVDETSFAKDPIKTKIVGARGHAATRTISSPGRDNTTVLLGASASGEKTPPLIVYKGKYVWDTWISSEAYPGTSYAATKNGWMETDVFESFFKKTFLPAVKNQRPVLLIYDGHSSHVGLNIIEEARTQNITILKLPSHTSHLLQPLDISVMKSFKDHWDSLLVHWQRLNVGSVMPKSEFAKLIGQTWAKIDPQVLRNGFRKGGIYPINHKVIEETRFDSLKLRHWKEYKLTQNVVKVNETLNNPKPLLMILLDFFNQMPLRKPTVDLKSIDYSNKLLQNPIIHQNVTFEELLLQKMRRGDNSPKPRRRKLAPGAEVITHNDVIEIKKEEQKKHEKTCKAVRKGKVVQPQSFTKITDDVVYLNNIPKNDCQLQPFTANDINNLPSCFQRKKVDFPKIKILSNVVIKQPNNDEKEEFYTRNKKYNKTPKLVTAEKENNVILQRDVRSKNYKILKTKIKQHKTLPKQRKEKVGPGFSNSNEKSKPGPSGLNRNRGKQRRYSISTTSVSGSISSYSDSEAADSISSNEDKDNYSNTSPRSLNMEKNVMISKVTSDEDSKNNDGEHQIPIYYVGDDVIVRYQTKQKWTYYVGQIEKIYTIDGEKFYSIRFYKTIKKPQLTFRMTKKIDRDDVPAILIVKKVDLTQNPVTLNYGFVGVENTIYF